MTSRKNYRERAQTARREYKLRYAAYLEQLTPMDAYLQKMIWRLKRVIDPTIKRGRPPRDIHTPKKPFSAFIRFRTDLYRSSQERQIELIGEPLNGSLLKHSSLLARAWKNAQPDVRAVSKNLGCQARVFKATCILGPRLCMYLPRCMKNRSSQQRTI